MKRVTIKPQKFNPRASCLKNENGGMVIVESDITQNIFNNLSNFFGRSVRVFLFAVFCLVIFLEGACASNTNYSEKECLTLTTEDQTYADASNRLVRIKELTQWLSLLKKNKAKMVLMEPSSKTEFINKKCYWLMPIHESQATHFVFWKAFLVQINGNEICEKDYSDDSCKPINN